MPVLFSVYLHQWFPTPRAVKSHFHPSAVSADAVVRKDLVLFTHFARLQITTRFPVLIATQLCGTPCSRKVRSRATFAPVQSQVYVSALQDSTYPACKKSLLVFSGLLRVCFMFALLYITSPVFLYMYSHCMYTPSSVFLLPYASVFMDIST